MSEIVEAQATTSIHKRDSKCLNAGANGRGRREGADTQWIHGDLSLTTISSTLKTTALSQR
jgi:hypothetical protein